MPSFDVSINIWTLLILVFGAALLGFAGRSRQLARKNRNIAELEKEMIQAHAELLEMQKDYCEMELRLKDVSPPPVIPIKSGQKQDPAPKPLSNRSDVQKDRPTGTA